MPHWMRGARGERSPKRFGVALVRGGSFGERSVEGVICMDGEYDDLVLQ